MGYVYLYTGDSKGKTTSALGLVVRALGHKKKVLLIQFMKEYPDTGECLFTYPNYEIKQFGNGCNIRKLNEFNIDDIVKASEGLSYAMNRTLSTKPDLLILDEINLAVAIGLLPEELVINTINNLRRSYPSLNIVLTGRYATKGLIDIADFANEVIEIKSPLNINCICDEGIQY